MDGGQCKVGLNQRIAVFWIYKLHILLVWIDKHRKYTQPKDRRLMNIYHVNGEFNRIKLANFSLGLHLHIHMHLEFNSSLQDIELGFAFLVHAQSKYSHTDFVFFFCVCLVELQHTNGNIYSINQTLWGFTFFCVVKLFGWIPWEKLLSKTSTTCKITSIQELLEVKSYSVSAVFWF